jgi:hypothetical protein
MITDVSLSEVLAENYHGIGAIGMEIVASVIDDLTHNRYEDDWIEAMEITRDDLSRELFSLVRGIIEGGYLNSMRTPDGWVELHRIKLADHDE